MRIITDDLTRPDVIALLEFHTRDMAAHSPDDTSYALDIDALKTPDMSVFTIWDNNALAGCAALHELGPLSAEIKSMRTADGFHRRGVGRKIL